MPPPDYTPLFPAGAKPLPLALCTPRSAYALTGIPIPLITQWIRDGAIYSERKDGLDRVELSEISSLADQLIDIEAKDLVIQAKALARGLTVGDFRGRGGRA